MAVVQIELILLHPALDRLLGPQAKVLDYDRFDILHRIYLMSSTVQWGAAIVHIWCDVAGKEF
jgi:hypothetical protein